jgi:hypothetical protein
VREDERFSLWQDPQKGKPLVPGLVEYVHLEQSISTEISYFEYFEDNNAIRNVQDQSYDPIYFSWFQKLMTIYTENLFFRKLLGFVTTIKTDVIPSKMWLMYYSIRRVIPCQYCMFGVLLSNTALPSVDGHKLDRQVTARFPK